MYTYKINIYMHVYIYVNIAIYIIGYTYIRTLEKSLEFCAHLLPQTNNSNY